MTITGKEFTEKYPNAELIKFTNKDDLHNGYQYKEGLNELDGPFNEEPICAKGGLYFCFKKDCGRWVEYRNMKMENAWCVKIPDDAKIVIMDGKMKTDKFILTDKRNIWSLEELCKLAVQQNGLYLWYVKEQTEELCKLAVQQNGIALQFVKEQTEELCKLAVHQNCHVLCHVKEQTEKICKLAVQQDSYALKYVKEQTEEICKLAIQQNGYALKHDKRANKRALYRAFNKTVMH
jgi:hypothetical protein